MECLGLYFIAHPVFVAYRSLGSSIFRSLSFIALLLGGLGLLIGPAMLKYQEQEEVEVEAKKSRAIKSSVDDDAPPKIDTTSESNLQDDIVTPTTANKAGDAVSVSDVDSSPNEVEETKPSTTAVVEEPKERVDTSGCAELAAECDAAPSKKRSSEIVHDDENSVTSLISWDPALRKESSAQKKADGGTTTEELARAVSSSEAKNTTRAPVAHRRNHSCSVQDTSLLSKEIDGNLIAGSTIDSNLGKAFAFCEIQRITSH